MAAAPGASLPSPLSQYWGNFPHPSIPLTAGGDRGGPSLPIPGPKTPRHPREPPAGHPAARRGRSSTGRLSPTEAPGRSRTQPSHPSPWWRGGRGCSHPLGARPFPPHPPFSSSTPLPAARHGPAARQVPVPPPRSLTHRLLPAAVLAAARRLPTGLCVPTCRSSAGIIPPHTHTARVGREQAAATAAAASGSALLVPSPAVELARGGREAGGLGAAGRGKKGEKPQPPPSPCTLAPAARFASSSPQPQPCPPAAGSRHFLRRAGAPARRAAGGGAPPAGRGEPRAAGAGREGGGHRGTRPLGLGVTPGVSVPSKAGGKNHGFDNVSRSESSEKRQQKGGGLTLKVLSPV